MGSHGTCHPTQANTPRLNPSQWRLVLDLPTPEGWKAELTWVAGYIPRCFTRPQTVTHPSTNRARCRVATLIETDTLPLNHATTHCGLLSDYFCRYYFAVWPAAEVMNPLPQTVESSSCVNSGLCLRWWTGGELHRQTAASTPGWSGDTVA